MTVCASALSVHPVAATATGEVVGALLESLGPEPDLVVVFATRPHTGALDDMVAAMRQLLRPRCLVGSTAVSIAGGAEEIEETPALSALAVRFPPGASCEGVRLQTVSSGDGTVVWGLPDTQPGDTFVLLADPYSFPVDPFLDGLHSERPSLVVLGGMASAAVGPGGNRLLLDGIIHDDGAVGVIIPASVATTAVVSQGCRPIGQPMVVTQSTGNMIERLASEPALARLLRLVESLDADERSLAARGLHVGVVVDETQAEFGPGDFLIRNVLGAVRDREAIAIGDRADVGTTVQFQVRDAASADADLRTLLSGHDASGALLFTCNGRGTHLFADPNHDAELVADHAAANVAGMFCAGEIGPVGGRPFVHGFTASILLFD